MATFSILAVVEEIHKVLRMHPYTKVCFTKPVSQSALWQLIYTQLHLLSQCSVAMGMCADHLVNIVNNVKASLCNLPNAAKN